MKDSMFSGKSVLLASAAIALMGASMAFPWFWFRWVETEGGSSMSATVEYYLFTVVDADDHTRVGALSTEQWQLMENEVTIMIGFMLSAVVLIFAILVDSRGWGLALGWLTAGLGVLSVGYYALGIGPSIDSGMLGHVGFYGQGSNAGDILYYHPLTGWWIAAFATVLAIAAAVLRSIVYFRTTPAEDAAKKKAFEGPWEGVTPGPSGRLEGDGHENTPTDTEAGDKDEP